MSEQDDKKPARALENWWLSFSFHLNPRGWYRWDCFIGQGFILEAAFLCLGISLGWSWKDKNERR